MVQRWSGTQTVRVHVESKDSTENSNQMRILKYLAWEKMYKLSISYSTFLCWFDDSRSHWPLCSLVRAFTFQHVEPVLNFVLH